MTTLFAQTSRIAACLDVLSLICIWGSAVVLLGGLICDAIQYWLPGRKKKDE